jgi:alkylation response protein AidB-like acyl-CoA dehydrogenase
MTAIAAILPEELVPITNAVEAFCKAEVIGRHEKHHDLLNDPRNTFRLDGRLEDAVIEHIRAVRMASAKAGFFNVSVPASLGGADLGMIAYYTLIEHVYRLCGPHNWLCDFVISHWAFGPSAVLSAVTEEARAQILPGMMAGEKMMCFGMSEPGAGSDAAMLQTRAVPDGNGWKISGRKIWTTHIPIADYCIVFAQTDPERAAKKQAGSARSWCRPPRPESRWKASSACMAISAAMRALRCSMRSRLSHGSWSGSCTTALRSVCWAFLWAGFTTQRAR